MRCGVLMVLLALPLVATAQHPGHLGKPPPARARARSQVVPKWPHRPDPRPMRTTHYLDIRVELNAGRIRVLGVVKGRFQAGPTVIPRFRGRFEVSLHAHGLMLDVVRFDLPLTAAAENLGPTPRGTGLGDRLGLGLAKGVTARIRVRVPFTARLTRVTIRDSLTGKKTRVNLSSVLPGKPRPRLPGDLRTRSFGKAREKGLDDARVLRGASPAPKKTTKKAKTGKPTRER